MCVHVHAMSLMLCGRLDGCPHCDSIRFKELEHHTHDSKRCLCYECRQDYARHTEIDTMEAVSFNELGSEQ